MNVTVRCRTVLQAVLAAAVFGAAAASAQTPAAPIAPELTGLGTIHMPVTTAVPKAQLFFNQGLRLLYAFNHQEARRAFEEAARLDPQLAMAHWGIALTLGPNLNAPMTADQGRQAFAAIAVAKSKAATASARERALIEALALRFAADPASPRPPLDQAYAAAMTRAAATYANDPDVQTLYADAMMNTMPWDYWRKDGSARPETTTIATALERTIAAHPEHAGAHHYYIHLIEASPTPERAERSADVLGALMPAAGHMVHMPAHIYLRVGRYADAAEANVRAIAADEDYLAQCQAQGLYPVSYYPHNLHFLWAAATFEGRSAVAIDAARQVAAKVPHHHAGQLAWTADFPVTPWLAYARFGRWQEILTEPKPPVSEPYATGIWHYARGLAFVGRRQTARAEAEIAALTAILGHDAFKTTLKDLPLLINLQIGSRLVRGELAARLGKFDEAIALVQDAVAIEDEIPYSEPPVWHHPPRQVLGALLLEAGRPKEAEMVYLEDLKRFRENGWSLFGLSQALEAQGRVDEARVVRERFEQAWQRADVTLTSSRVIDETKGGIDRRAHDHARGEIMQRTVALPNGVTLEYAERGRASGIPVVFLHGVTDSWRSFEPVMELLPDTFRAIAITQRGHGRSSKPQTGYRYTDMANDLAAFMDAIHLDSAIVVGHSMGGSVAQRFAVDHPTRVAGLVLMGAFSTLHENAGIQQYWDSTLKSLADPIDAAVAREFQVSTIARPVAPDLLEMAIGESLQVPARVWRETFRGFLDTADFSHELRGVTAPALILWGERDSYADRAAQEVLTSMLPKARLVTYRGGGHAVHWEDPAAVAHDIVSFAVESKS